MSDLIDGIYSAYLTGSVGQGLALLVFRNGQITGADAMGVVFDGHYANLDDDTLSIKLTTKSPAHISLIQGGITGPEGEANELGFTVPRNFDTLEYIRIETKRGPINAKLVKLRGLE